METKLALLALALFAAFIVVRVVITGKANDAINAVMKKWRKDTDGG